MGYSILMVDDSEIIRGVLGRTIRMVGIPLSALHQAVDGVSALKVLEGQLVDLILTDINMPGMDGLAFVKALQVDPVLCEIPVAVISTEGSDQMRQAFVELKVKAFLRKPFTPEKIKEMLSEVMPGWSNL